MGSRPIAAADRLLVRYILQTAQGRPKGPYDRHRHRHRYGYIMVIINRHELLHNYYLTLYNLVFPSNFSSQNFRVGLTAGCGFLV